MINPIRRIYDWTFNLAKGKHALRALVAVSFIESSVFPIPPDVLLIPMVIAERSKAWLYASACTLASVIGGAFGYAIGHFLYDTVGAPLVELYGYTEQFKNFSGLYNEWGFWIVVGAGFTPFPYKVVTIASGVTGLNFPLFIITSVIGRAARFFLVAGLLWRYGPKIRDFIEKYLGLVAFGGFCLLVGGFAAVKYLV